MKAVNAAYKIDQKSGAIPELDLPNSDELFPTETIRRYKKRKVAPTFSWIPMDEIQDVRNHIRHLKKLSKKEKHILYTQFITQIVCLIAHFDSLGDVSDQDLNPAELKFLTGEFHRAFEVIKSNLLDQYTQENVSKRHQPLFQERPNFENRIVHRTVPENIYSISDRLLIRTTKEENYSIFNHEDVPADALLPPQYRPEHYFNPPPRPNFTEITAKIKKEMERHEREQKELIKNETSTTNTSGNNSNIPFSQRPKPSPFLTQRPPLNNPLNAQISQKLNSKRKSSLSNMKLNNNNLKSNFSMSKSRRGSIFDIENNLNSNLLLNNNNNNSKSNPKINNNQNKIGIKSTQGKGSKLSTISENEEENENQIPEIIEIRPSDQPKLTIKKKEKRYIPIRYRERAVFKNSKESNPPILTIAGMQPEVQYLKNATNSVNFTRPESDNCPELRKIFYTKPKSQENEEEEETKIKNDLYVPEFKQVVKVQKDRYQCQPNLTEVANLMLAGIEMGVDDPTATQLEIALDKLGLTTEEKIILSSKLCTVVANGVDEYQFKAINDAADASKNYYQVYREYRQFLDFEPAPSSIKNRSSLKTIKLKYKIAKQHFFIAFRDLENVVGSRIQIRGKYYEQIVENKEKKLTQSLTNSGLPTTVES